MTAINFPLGLDAANDTEGIWSSPARQGTVIFPEGDDTVVLPGGVPRVSGILQQCAQRGRVEIPATVSDEVAKALSTKDPLAREGLAVAPIAWDRFVSQGDARGAREAGPTD